MLGHRSHHPTQIFQWCQRARVCFQRLLDSGYGTRYLDRQTVGADSSSVAASKAQNRAPSQGPPHRRERYPLDRPHWSLEWRDLPPEYGPWRSVATRFYRWVKAGVWEQVLGELQRRAGAEGEIDWKLHHVDGSVVRAHQHAAGASTTGAKKGAPSTPRRLQGRGKIRRHWDQAEAGSQPKSTCAPKGEESP